MCALKDVGRFRFELASAADDRALQEFGRSVETSGTIRFAFERHPDYFNALRVEGGESEVLVCRVPATGRIVATGHRSIKSMFVNGEAMPVGYLGGLRLAESARHGHVLSRGYAFLRERHSDGRASFYLTTIMEENREAKAALLSGRCGLPHYHDFGRFCCMAVSFRTKHSFQGNGNLRVRNAGLADASAIIAFLGKEGRSRQFFPEYHVNDFGIPGGLLSHLAWEDVFLAFRGNELIGMVAAWDQRAIRRWRITGYATWLRLTRRPFNLMADLRGMPCLPRLDEPLDYFILSLICIQHDDRAVFNSLLEEIIHKQRQRHGFFLAGLHERDPLLPELLARPHFPFPSRLYVVAWEDGMDAVKRLDRGLVPYLELGSL